jgi:hypothetical protein
MKALISCAGITSAYFACMSQRTIVAVVASGCARREIVLALIFVAATDADAFQTSHYSTVIGRKLLRIDAKCTEKFC